MPDICLGMQTKSDFPIFLQHSDLTYLDSAATTQKPQIVIDALIEFYGSMNANIHRGIYKLSENATNCYENSRKELAKFINAKPCECIFTSGATAAINLVANGLQDVLKAGDEIVITELDHHANIVPWQELARKTSATLRYIPILANGDLDLRDIETIINDRTKIVACTHISNTLGTVVDVKSIIEIAHKHNARVLLDGAQALANTKVNVKELDVDYYVMSGHKTYGPTGIGALYGKESALEELTPYQTGGGMIRTVSMEKTTFAPVPERFEAGTPPIAQAYGFSCALKYLTSVGFDKISQHKFSLLEYAKSKLATISNLVIHGSPKTQAGILSFTFTDIHPHDIGTIVDSCGIAVRAGHHCTMPLMTKLQLPATARASFGIYNTEEDVDKLYDALIKTRKIFGK